MNNLKEIIHTEVIVKRRVKEINLAIFGHGLVGGALINQILESQFEIENKQNIRITIFCIANSKQVLLNQYGIDKHWKTTISNLEYGYTVDDVIDYAKTHSLQHLIAIDNTASNEFIKHYKELIESGFHLVSSNKIANTIDLNFYNQIRHTLKANQKEYLYETNVGAGLPLIDTIKLLHLSGENITRIRGVFSGTLSYIFNVFSEEERPFSDVLKDTITKGYTEPDPREDLNGNDVGRKLLILARELELFNELEDVSIQNLIPEPLQHVSTSQFLEHLADMDLEYEKLKQNQKPNCVLRYTGDLYGNLFDHYGATLEVKLESVPKESPLGSLKGADSIFEIYTESYGNQPLIVQGAGAGAQVTARGVFGDILRIAKLNNM